MNKLKLNREANDVAIFTLREVSNMIFSTTMHWVRSPNLGLPSTWLITAAWLIRNIIMITYDWAYYRLHWIGKFIPKWVPLWSWVDETAAKATTNLVQLAVNVDAYHLSANNLKSHKIIRKTSLEKPMNTCGRLYFYQIFYWKYAIFIQKEHFLFKCQVFCKKN